METKTIITVRTEQVSRPRAHFATAFDKGAIAAAAGESEAACPYGDGHRMDTGGVTWSRAWRNAWLKGHRAVMDGEVDVEVEPARE